jgi:hypothetical protein
MAADAPAQLVWSAVRLTQPELFMGPAQAAGLAAAPSAAAASTAPASAPAAAGGDLSAAGVWLGQALHVRVTLRNAGGRPARAPGVRIEVASDRGRACLLEAPAPPPDDARAVLAPGDEVAFELAHEVRDLGPHALVCAAATGGAGAGAQAAFRFVAGNPLSVHTKVRAAGTAVGTAGAAVLLEATVENRTAEPMLLLDVALRAAPGWAAERVAPAGAAAPALLPPETGAAGVVFRLERAAPGAAAPAASPPRSPHGSPGASPRGAGALGRLELRWVGPSGDAARLQTRGVEPPAPPPGDAELALAAPLPGGLRVERPFALRVAVRARAGAPPLGAALLSLAPPRGGAPAALAIEGPQSVPVPPVPVGGERVVALPLVALAPGLHVLDGVRLTDAADGRLRAALPPLELFVLG